MRASVDDALRVGVSEANKREKTDNTKQKWEVKMLIATRLYSQSYDAPKFAWGGGCPVGFLSLIAENSKRPRVPLLDR